MENKLHIEYSHLLQGHFPADDIDTAFYKTLTGVEERYIDPSAGFPATPIPSLDQVLTVVGTTLLSSANIASMIKAWLDTNKTRITISDLRAQRNVEFKGPNLDMSVESIKDKVDRFVMELNSNQIRIRAVYI